MRYPPLVVKSNRGEVPMFQLLTKIRSSKDFAELLSQNPIRGAIQAFIGSFCYLAIVSNTRVWNALTFQGVGPVIGFIGFGLALQADIGGNAIYVAVRIISTLFGGGLGLLILYLVYWCNGSSFESSVTKGAVLVVFLCAVLTVLAYHFRGPPWSARYKGILIAGNMLIFVSTIGYWQDKVLPKIFAYTLLNMLMGLFLASVMSHFVLPITQGKTVVKLMNDTAILLSEATAAASDEVQAKGPTNSRDLLNEYIIPIGDNILKCKLLLQGSVPTEVDIRSWPFKRFPVKTYTDLSRISRQYLSVYGTLVDLIHRSHICWNADGQKDIKGLIDLLSSEICQSLLFFVEFTSSPSSGLFEIGLTRVRGLQASLNLTSKFLNSPVYDMERVQGSSRAVLTTFWLLGLQMTDYYLLMVEIRSWSYPDQRLAISEYERAFMDILSSIKDHFPLRRERKESGARISEISTLPEAPVCFKPDEHSFKHHRSDVISRTLRNFIYALNLKPLYLKHVLQQGVATSIAAILVVCTNSHNAFRGFADWILITVWVMGAQSTIGAVALKALNRVVGTIIAGIVSYVIIYVVFLLNGLSYNNRAPKYIFMTLLYPATLSYFQNKMLQSDPEYQYAWYVMKLTLPIVVLSSYNDEDPNPETAAWRILCILLGLGIEFIVKFLIYYRESSTSARHEIQKMCKSMARLASESIVTWQQQPPEEYLFYTPTHTSGAEAAQCTSNIVKLQNFLKFEDRIQEFACGVNLFDRTLINTTSLPKIRHHLRVILNRILTLTYLKNCILAFDQECILTKGSVRDDLQHILSWKVPQSLMDIADLFGPLRSSSLGFYNSKNECAQSISELQETVSILWKDELDDLMSQDGGDLVSATVFIAYINILASLGQAMSALLDCICKHTLIEVEGGDTFS